MGPTKVNGAPTAPIITCHVSKVLPVSAITIMGDKERARKFVIQAMTAAPANTVAATVINKASVSGAMAVEATILQGEVTEAAWLEIVAASTARLIRGAAEIMPVMTLIAMAMACAQRNVAPHMTAGTARNASKECA